MIVTVDLAALLGAEVVKKDGMIGVFIPMACNVRRVYGKDGEHMYISFKLNKYGRKGISHRGRVCIPESMRDLALRDSRFLTKSNRCIWAFEDRVPGVSEKEFDDVLELL